ncbi:MAG TPA: hypoxanthine phosphoribosyltransferase [Dehalococcoidia bacterium]|nr:hypoxanthine phosphoribosyltransferase [Dehalococcoidia bacterium]
MQPLSAKLHPPTTIEDARFAHESEEEFARLLDFYGVRWQYEPRTFTLRQTDDGRIIEAFSPDFFLPDLNLFIELTTLKQGLVTDKHRKLRRLRELHPDIQIKLLYKKDYLNLLRKYDIGAVNEHEHMAVQEVLISASEIERRVNELGVEIARDYAGKDVLFIGVLKGVTCFMADLMRHTALPVSVDFMTISSYEGDRSGAVRIVQDLTENIRGRDVLIIEDIVDTGMTLNHLMKQLQAREPSSLRVCALLDKRVRRLVDVPLDYVGFEVPDEFVVGYGLDYRQRFRNLPFVATLRPEALEAPPE